MIVVKKSSFLVECFPVGRMSERGRFKLHAEGHRTRNPLYKMLVTVLLLPLVEFVVVKVIDVRGMGVGSGRHIPLFPFAFIRGHFFGREEGVDIRIVSGKQLELG